MEIQKILNEANVFKFVTRKWNIVNYDAEVLRSNLCDYSDAYILVTGNITLIGHQETQVAFKNCAPFTNCIPKIDRTRMVDAENLDLVMPMYNLIVQIVLKPLKVYAFIKKMKQLILMQTLLMIIILNIYV